MTPQQVQEELERRFPLVIPKGIGGGDEMERGYLAANRFQRADTLRRVAAEMRRLSGGRSDMRLEDQVKTLVADLEALAGEP